MTFAVGSLVKAREREWVVLPESTDDLLVLRPLGGADDEVTGIYLPLERVEPARFDLPDPARLGDFRSCRLLRDAVRLGFRSSAGPFRSFAQLAVEPRPYQLVPLLMALKLDPVRLLIADDVGIGKTVEACLIARELLDRGEARRLAVLCPPHLAEQWQAELRTKFNINAELLLPSTVTRLERDLHVGQSLFDFYPFLIVSTDLIKSDRRRDDFLRSCPELVIVDEAHTCASQTGSSGGRHLRNQLLKGLAGDAQRHLILVTATPHSGKEEAFRSLLALLKPEFAELPDDLTGTGQEAQRRQLAQHFVQRRRGDIRHYLDADTPFPERVESETTYKLSPEYKQLFNRVLAFARETVQDDQGGVRHRQRVRWWSALALLRSMASSPAAAAATLRSRAAVADAQTTEDVDEIGRRTVLDFEEDETAERLDATPGADPTDPDAEGDEQSLHRRLLALAREAEELFGDRDEKLKKAAKLIKELLNEGCRPIVFCRFIPTAEYLATELRARLPKGVEVIAVTGTLPHAEREERVRPTGESPQACSGLHRLSERGHQPPGALRRGHSLRPGVEPHAPRTARGACRPLCPAHPGRPRCDLLRCRQPDRRPGAGRTDPPAQGDPQLAGDFRPGSREHKPGDRGRGRGPVATRQENRDRAPAALAVWRLRNRRRNHSSANGKPRPTAKNALALCLPKRRSSLTKCSPSCKPCVRPSVLRQTWRDSCATLFVCTVRSFPSRGTAKFEWISLRFRAPARADRRPGQYARRAL